MGFNPLSRRPTAPPSRRPRCHRPCLELLESRLVPSTIDHSGGFLSHSDLTNNGSATYVGTQAQLTSGAQNQAGSIFTNTTFDITQFTTMFTFVQTAVTSPSGGGLTFTIQNVSPTAVGTNQDGLGYAGINNSVAIKFDLFDNANQVPYSATGIFTDGRDPTDRQPGLPSQFPDMSVNLAGTGIDLHSGDTFRVTLTYNGSSLGETIFDLNTGISFSTAYSVNIPSIVGSNTAFVGFTGSSGGFTAMQNIQTWQGTFGPQSSFAPIITSLNPTSVQAGSSSFVLTVNGANFGTGATVLWSPSGGTLTALTPFTPGSSSQLQVLVPSSLVTTPGTVSITVSQLVGRSFVNSNAATFTITPFPPFAPVITSISPPSVPAGSSNFSVIVSGTNFVSGATVQWTTANGTTMSLPTTPLILNGTLQLVGSVSSSLVASPGTATITVTQTVNGSQQTSNGVTFFIGTPPSVAPIITSIVPSSMPQGSPSFDLSVFGSNFVSGAVVQWTANGTTTSLPTTLESVNGVVLLLAIVQPSQVTAPGTVSITVTQVVNGITLTSNAVPFTVTTAPGAPMITSISPTSVPPGSSTFTLTVNGSNFMSGATVQWTTAGGTTISLPTTPIIVNSTIVQLQASVDSSLVASSGTAAITVTQTVNGFQLTSNAVNFTIGPSPFIPVITSLSPPSVQAGSGSFTLIVNGSNFVLGASVVWTANGRSTPLIPFSVSSSQILVIVPSSLLTTPVTAFVTVNEVVNAIPQTSNAMTFVVSPTAPAPIISSISPTSVQQGSGSFTLTVNGANFASGATVQWSQNGATTSLLPFLNTGSQLQVVVPSSLLNTAGTVSITVTQVVNGITLTSNAVSFLVVPPIAAPIITSISPPSVQQGSGSFTLTVNGANFASGATVQWSQNGGTTPLLPFLNTGSQLQVVVPSSLLTTTGTVSITVTQVVNGSTLTSNAVTFAITPVSTAISATGLNITATVNVAQDFTVAQFTDLNPNAQTGAYAVSIDFGDGTPLQAGRVTQPGGAGTPFFVDATHTYTQTGTFTVHVEIFKEIEGFAQTFSTATVIPAGGADGPGGGNAALLGSQPLLQVNELQVAGPVSALSPSAKTSVTPVPIQSSTSTQSGQSSNADDLYWQLVGTGQIGDGNDWVSSDPVSTLGGGSL
jgi:hypothetical protein